MKKWLIYLAGIVTGVIITLLFAYIFASKYSSDDTNLSEDDEFTYFDKPGEKLENDAFKVFQVIDDDAALVMGKNKEIGDIEIFKEPVFLLINDDNKYYYDDEIVRVPEGKVARQIGIHRYETKSNIEKTVPIIQIMDK